MGSGPHRCTANVLHRCTLEQIPRGCHALGGMGSELFWRGQVGSLIGSPDCVCYPHGQPLLGQGLSMGLSPIADKTLFGLPPTFCPVNIVRQGPNWAEHMELSLSVRLERRWMESLQFHRLVNMECRINLLQKGRISTEHDLCPGL